jgi:hypothetical protein
MVGDGELEYYVELFRPILIPILYRSAAFQRDGFGPPGFRQARRLGKLDRIIIPHMVVRSAEIAPAIRPPAGPVPDGVRQRVHVRLGYISDQHEERRVGKRGKMPIDILLADLKRRHGSSLRRGRSDMPFAVIADQADVDEFDIRMIVVAGAHRIDQAAGVRPVNRIGGGRREAG